MTDLMFSHSILQTLANLGVGFSSCVAGDGPSLKESILFDDIFNEISATDVASVKPAAASFKFPDRTFESILSEFFDEEIEALEAEETPMLHKTNSLEPEEDYVPLRSLFDVMESDFFYDDEISDPVVLVLHESVKQTILSLHPQDATKAKASPLKTLVKEKNVSNSSSVKNCSNSHRSAQAMKDFATQLNPHIFMVQLTDVTYCIVYLLS